MNTDSKKHDTPTDANNVLVAVPFSEIKVGDKVQISHPMTGENCFDEVSEIDVDDYSIALKELGWNFSPDDEGNYLVRHCH